jgi:hypothetical protein
MSIVSQHAESIENIEAIDGSNLEKKQTESQHRDKKNAKEQVTEPANVMTITLYKLLKHLLKQIQKQDNECVLDEEPTETQRYSRRGTNQIVDLQYMTTTLKENQYISLVKFRDDFESMCNRLITENKGRKKFVKHVKILQAYGKHILSPDEIRSKLIQLTSQRQGISAEITAEELGFEINTGKENISTDGDSVDTCIVDYPKKHPNGHDNELCDKAASEHNTISQ